MESWGFAMRFDRMFVAVVLGLSIVSGCDDRCIRNSDCPSGQSCTATGCAVPPRDGGVDLTSPKDMTSDQATPDLKPPPDLINGG